jgi:hypothetical protein
MPKRKIAIHILAAALLTGILAIPTQAAQVTGCYASLEDKLLTLGNSRISRVFEWNTGDLKTISMTDVRASQTLVMERQQSDIRLATLTAQVKSGQWAKRTVEDAMTHRHLQVEVTTVYEQIDVRRVFRIYPDCPVIACDYYVRAHKGEIPAFQPGDTVLQSLRLPDAHWHYRAVEFFDRTDGINNLVPETSALAYLGRTELKGNILFGQNAKHDTAIFMVKEAPCSFVQLHHPGYDYTVSSSELRALGMGVLASDLRQDQWIRVYGLATGLSSKSETAFLTSLRTYQKLRRRHAPERDDMIMMAWFEGSGLPDKAFVTGAVIKAYRQHQSRIHEGCILPIGKEPNGTSWTGFQSMLNEKEGYVLVFREYTPTSQNEMSLYDLANQSVSFEQICGQGKDFKAKVDAHSRVSFVLPSRHSFALYQYRVSKK